MSYFSIDNINPVSAVTINSSGSTISIGNDAVAQHMNIGTGAAARTITVGNVTGATALAFNAGTGGINMASTGTGDITINSDDTLLLDADGALELNSAAGIIGIGNDANAFAINIGTGAAARTITVGNTSATAVNIDAIAITATSVDALTLTDGTASFILGGTGATSISGATTLDLDCTGAFTINSSGGTISIGNDHVAQHMNIGTGAGARTITIGNITGATEVNITSGAIGNITLDAGGSEVVLKSGGTQYGALTNSDGNLIIKSDSTTALTFTGADIQMAGSLSFTTIDPSTTDTDKFLVSESGTIAYRTGEEVAEDIGAVTLSAENSFSALQTITVTPESNREFLTTATHFNVTGNVAINDSETSASGTNSNIAAQVAIAPVSLSATSLSVTTTTASTFYIEGPLTASTNNTITNAYSLYIGSGASRFGGNITSTGFLINTYDTVTFGSTGEITGVTVAGGTVHDPISSTVFLNSSASSTATTYHWDLEAFTGGGNGSILHLFFDKTVDTGITALQVNFGTDGLLSGSGSNDYISFTTTGQSASLIYISSAWRIINTGGTIG
jgi:hypothetical protein